MAYSLFIIIINNMYLLNLIYRILRNKDVK